jgi:hypothetical protein
LYPWRKLAGWFDGWIPCASGAPLSKHEQVQLQDLKTELEASQIAREIGTGTVLVKNDAALPTELRFESEPYVEEWKVVTDLDRNEFDRTLRALGPIYRLVGKGFNDRAIASKLNASKVTVHGGTAWLSKFLDMPDGLDLISHAHTTEHPARQLVAGSLNR